MEISDNIQPQAGRDWGRGVGAEGEGGWVGVVGILLLFDLKLRILPICGIAVWN